MRRWSVLASAPTPSSMADVHKLRSTPVYDSALAHLQLAVANAKSTRELNKAISELQAIVSLAVADASEKWNARKDRMWRKLPPEVRTECFGYLLIRDIVALSLTSRKWHAYCVATPSLWSNVYYPHSFVRTVRQLRVVLRLSADCRLDMELTASSSADVKVADALLPHALRLRSLVLMASGQPVDATKLLNRLLQAGPLPRLRTLDISRDIIWRDIPSDLWRMFSGLHCLNVQHTPLPCMPCPTPGLRRISCVLDHSTNAQKIFHLCPNIQALNITGIGFRPTPPDALPQGYPPASLREFILRGRFFTDLSGYFGEWIGRHQLQYFHVETPRLELEPIVALFASVCTGASRMTITSRSYTSFELALACKDRQGPRFLAHFCTNADTGTGILAGCAHQLATLTELGLSRDLLGLLGASGTVTLPALTRLEISEEGRIPTYKLSPGLTAIIRAPCLRTIDICPRKPYHCPEDRQTFESLLALRSLVEFDSPKLEQISFRMNKERLDRVDKDGDISRRLHELAATLLFADSPRTRQG